MSSAREAGGSIKPGVERGFASATPGLEVEKDSSPRSGRRIHRMQALSPAFAGSLLPLASDPGVPLAEPRSTLGFMLLPAPRLVLTLTADPPHLSRQARHVGRQFLDNLPSRTHSYSLLHLQRPLWFSSSYTKTGE